MTCKQWTMYLYYRYLFVFPSLKQFFKCAFELYSKIFLNSQLYNDFFRIENEKKLIKKRQTMCSNLKILYKTHYIVKYIVYIIISIIYWVPVSIRVPQIENVWTKIWRISYKSEFNIIVAKVHCTFSRGISRQLSHSNYFVWNFDRYY